MKPPKPAVFLEAKSRKLVISMSFPKFGETLIAIAEKLERKRKLDDDERAMCDLFKTKTDLAGRLRNLGRELFTNKRPAGITDGQLATLMTVLAGGRVPPKAPLFPPDKSA